MNRRSAWRWHLLLMAVLGGIFLALPEGTWARVAAYNAAGLLGAVTISVGAIRNRPNRAWAWHLSAVGVALFVAGDVAFTVLAQLHGEAPFPSIADVLYLAAYPVLTVSLLVLLRAREPGGDRAAFLDAAVITTGIGVMVWAFLVIPYTSDQSLTVLQRWVGAGYPLMDVLLLAIAVRLSVRARGDGPAQRLLAGAILLILITDGLYGLAQLNGGWHAGTWFDLGWMAGYAFWGAAALHPTMVRLSQPTGPRDSPLKGRRLALLASATFLAPATLAYQHLRGVENDALVLIGGAVALFSLVLVRLGGMVRSLERVRSREQALSEESRRAAELHEREAAERRHRTLRRNASDIVLIVDPAGVVLDASPSLEQLTGFAPEQVIGRSLAERVHTEDVVALTTFLLHDVTSEGGASVELRVDDIHGRRRHWDIVGADLGNDPDIGGILLTARDISERKALEAELRTQALQDRLTGLANRTLFLDRVEHALSLAVSQGSLMALLFVDLDDFKTINDSFSHETGDALLLEVARRLRDHVGQFDTVARLGGDEFAILLEDVRDPQTAVAMAEGLRKALSEPLMVEGLTAAIAASIGIALADGSDAEVAGWEANRLLRDADLAMYVAKRAGKNRVDVFLPEMHAAVVERLATKTQLQRAVERREFRLEYQPIVELATGRVVGAEALIRWEHPERGLVPPLQFIPLAEETGQIVPIGRWVLEEACRTVGTWQRDFDPSIYLSVNLSTRQLEDPSIVSDVDWTLGTSGLAPGSLLLELTESVLMSNEAAVRRRLVALKDLGTSLALDDFGTGYSSLGYLQQFPVDVIKIDRTFVLELDRERPLANSIVQLTDGLGAVSLAEGIEHEAQRESLMAMGCQYGQGYLFGRPMPAEEFVAKLLVPYAAAVPKANVSSRRVTPTSSSSSSTTHSRFASTA